VLRHADAPSVILYSPEIVCRRVLVDPMDPKSFRTWEWYPPPFRQDGKQSPQKEKLPTRRSAELISIQRCEPSTTRFCARLVSLFMMMKKTKRIEIAKKIISYVKREMQKPRLTESVRNERDQAAPVVEEGGPRRNEGRSSI
jgi:hypothetical protein